MDAVCRILKISRAAYYKWSTGELSPRTAENERIADLVEDIHEKHPEMGYRRLKDELDKNQIAGLLLLLTCDLVVLPGNPSDLASDLHSLLEVSGSGGRPEHSSVSTVDDSII